MVSLGKELHWILGSADVRPVMISFCIAGVLSFLLPVARFQMRERLKILLDMGIV